MAKRIRVGMMLENGRGITHAKMGNFRVDNGLTLW